MKLDPSLTPAQIETLLRSQAERVYGEERASELAGQIEHLSRMLAEVASRECDLTEIPPYPVTGSIRGER